MQLAPRQRRFKHIAGIHCAFGLARADQRVQLVQKQDVAARVHRQFLQHGFEPLLEFAAIFRAREQCGQVEHQHLLAFQRLRHLLVHNPLREALDDGSLAYAGFADQHRIVLGAALQNLDGAADFIVAPDHWVELACARALGQVERVFGERLALAFGIG